MDGLTFIGNMIYLVVGVCIGAAIMYIGILLIDKKYDEEDKYLYTEKDLISAWKDGYMNCRINVTRRNKDENSTV